MNSEKSGKLRFHFSSIGQLSSTHILEFIHDPTSPKFTSHLFQIYSLSNFLVKLSQLSKICNLLIRVILKITLSLGLSFIWNILNVCYLHTQKSELRQRGTIFSQRNMKSNNFFMKKHLLYNIQKHDKSKMKAKSKFKLKLILPPT
jgi:hypothetical protein